MSKLSRYLAKEFILQALPLFLVVTLLVWTTQVLRLFDILTTKGQGIFTLLLQSSLTTPSLAMALIYISMGIGLARVLRSMQQSRELHSIHSLKKTASLWQALGIFTFGGMIFVTLVANIINPYSLKTSTKLNEEIAANLISSTLNPNQFSEISPNLVIVIGGRSMNGKIIDFFADDRRDPKTHKTFISNEAEIVYDDEGYNISLIDGTAQFMRENNQFTQVSFNKYEISLNRIGTDIKQTAIKETSSFQLILEGTRANKISTAVWKELNTRFSETLRVLALCLLVGAIASYPHARRGRSLLPLEAVVLVIGLGERAIGSVLEKTVITGAYTSGLLLVMFAIIIIFLRQGIFKSSKNSRVVA